MIEGLAKNKGTLITILSAIPVNRMMLTKFYFKGETEEVNGTQYKYLAFINFPILRHICLFITCFLNPLKWLFKNENGVLICDVLKVTTSSASLIVSKIARKNSVGIITDIPSLLERILKNRINFANKIIVLIEKFTMKRFNSYIFLTRYTDMLINKKHKSYVVIEGQVDIGMVNNLNDLSGKYEKKVCIYAGKLRNVYGMKLLTDAFMAADIDNAEPHI